VGGENQRQKVLYIAGVGRSGTTLISQILGQLPGFVNAGEIRYFFSRGVQNDELCGCGLRFSECAFWSNIVRSIRIRPSAVTIEREVRRVSRLRSGYGRAAFGDSIRRLTMDSDSLETIASVYRAIGATTGEDSVVVDSSKSVAYLSALARSNDLDITVLHVTRDPRSVAESWSRRMRRPEVLDRVEMMPRLSPSRSAIAWTAKNLLMELTRIQMQDIPVSRVSYESIVSAPRRTINEVGAPFGVAPATVEALISEDGAFSLDVSHTVSGNPMRFESGSVRIAPDLDWKSAISLRDAAAVTTISLPLMLAYGYRITP
jgi:hypothetical protein